MKVEEKQIDDQMTLSIISSRKKYLWAFLFLLLVLGSVFAIVGTNKSFSLFSFFAFLKEANPLFLILAILSMLGFIVSEGCALTTITKSFGYKHKKSNGFFYSAADIYFSAITPSASGGQPASAYFMLKDGVSGPIVTVTLFYNLMLYSVSILIISFFAFLIFPSLYFELHLVSKLLIGFGFLVQFLLIALFYCLLYQDKLLFSICRFVLTILSKVHFISNVSEKLTKLNKVMEKYQENAKLLKGKKKVLLKALFFNLLQRSCQISVVIFVFLATQGSIDKVVPIWTMQSFVILGAYCVPIPGAMGVTDYLMLDGFKLLLNSDIAVNLELLARAMSFYICIFVCGFAILGKYLSIKRSSKK